MDITYCVNPYDEMIKNAKKMIKECIDQYEYDRDYAIYEIEGYEFNVNDVKDERIQNIMEALKITLMSDPLVRFRLLYAQADKVDHSCALGSLPTAALAYLKNPIPKQFWFG